MGPVNISASQAHLVMDKNDPIKSAFVPDQFVVLDYTTKCVFTGHICALDHFVKNMHFNIYVKNMCIVLLKLM